jgi:hypothetical protein
MGTPAGVEDMVLVKKITVPDIAENLHKRFAAKCGCSFPCCGGPHGIADLWRDR